MALDIKIHGRTLTPQQLDAIAPVLNLRVSERMSDAEFEVCCLRAMEEAGYPLAGYDNPRRYIRLELAKRIIAENPKFVAADDRDEDPRDTAARVIERMYEEADALRSSSYLTGIFHAHKLLAHANSYQLPSRTMSGSGWTLELTRRWLQDGAKIEPFNGTYMKISLPRPRHSGQYQDRLNRFVGEGAPDYREGGLIQIQVAMAALDELRATETPVQQQGGDDPDEAKDPALMDPTL